MNNELLINVFKYLGKLSFLGSVTGGLLALIYIFVPSIFLVEVQLSSLLMIGGLIGTGIEGLLELLFNKNSNQKETKSLLNKYYKLIKQLDIATRKGEIDQLEHIKIRRKLKDKLLIPYFLAKEESINGSQNVDDELSMLKSQMTGNTGNEAVQSKNDIPDAELEDLRRQLDNL
ncbi:MAG: hypothetical protein AB4063_01735 [Crocosphaera sp.]